MAFHFTDKTAVHRVERAILHDTIPFYIPVSQVFVAPNDEKTLYAMLENAARQAHVNIIRPSLGYTRTGQKEIMDFVYLTRPTQLAHDFTIKNGRFLTIDAMRHANRFLSTVATGKATQVGQLSFFGAQPWTEILPFSQLKKYLFVTGDYWIETTSKTNYDLFVHTFTQAVNQTFHAQLDHAYSVGSFEHGTAIDWQQGFFSNFGVWGSGWFQYIPYEWFLIFSVTLILVLYACFDMAKRLGIMKLQGTSYFRLWFSTIGRFILVFFLMAVALDLLAGLWIPDDNVTFVKNVVVANGAVFAGILLVSLVVIVYAVRMNTKHAIKNHKDTTGILMLNTVIKTVWLLVLVFLLGGLSSDYVLLTRAQVQLQTWRETPQTQHYGVFYPVENGLDTLNGASSGFEDQLYVTTKWLYPVLNQMGAIYEDASQYEEDALSLPLSPGVIRTIIVNPNFLRAFPLYRTNGHVVKISEKQKKWVVLIPIAYRNHEKQILQFIKSERLFEFQTQSSHFNQKTSTYYEHQPIQILWLANHQQVFGFDPTVFPRQHSMIVQPILEVLTIANSLPNDRGEMTNGAGLGEALKIPLIHGSAKQTFRKMEPLLQHWQMNDYLYHFLSDDEALQAEIQFILSQLVLLSMSAIGISLCAFFLLLQSLKIFFTRYQRRFIVRRLYGTGLWRTYQEYWRFFLVTWLGQFVLSYLIAWLTESSLFIFLFITLALCLLEMMISAFLFYRIERRNVSRFLKKEW